MALPQTQPERDLAARLWCEHLERERRLLCDLLGRWVSELEPVIVRDYEPVWSPQIMGLAVAGDPSSTIQVRNPAYKPRRSFYDLCMSRSWEIVPMPQAVAETFAW